MKSGQLAATQREPVRPCKAVMQPQSRAVAEADSQVSFAQRVSIATGQQGMGVFRLRFRGLYSCEARLQGNKPIAEWSYEALEKALIQEKLKGMEVKRGYQLEQAWIAQSNAITKKAIRVLNRRRRRTREVQSSVRLLETKLAMAGATEVASLHKTMEEKQEDLQRTQEEVAFFKEMFLRMKVRHCCTNLHCCCYLSAMRMQLIG